jgi:hypothetical protein
VKIFHQIEIEKYPTILQIPSTCSARNRYILYWDQSILTDKTIYVNRSDILLIHELEQKANIVDVAVPLSHNVESTEREKIQKYQNLTGEIKNIWKLKEVGIHPLIISAEEVL